jgi:MraZ protein
MCEFLFYISAPIFFMAGFIGEFLSTVDSKGRFLLPAGLKKQIAAREQKFFVVNRGMEKHLMLYTRKLWDEVSAKVDDIDEWVEENRVFAHQFYKGATEIALDSADRLLLPLQLMAYAGIEKDIVLFAHGKKIEVWSEKEYKKRMNDDSINYSRLAQKVMSRKNRDEHDRLS